MPYLLYPYCEVPQESTGFSAFELLYGQKVRGPLDILKETWTGYAAEGAQTPVAAYVLQMRDCLEEMSDLVQKSLGEGQQRQKALYDRGAKELTFEVGDLVLVLLPMQHYCLKLEWVGPYKAVKRVTLVDNEVETSHKHGTKTYHVNLLKRWYSTAEPRSVCLALCPNQSIDDLEEDAPVVDLCLDGDLYPEASAPDGQRRQLQDIITEFPWVFEVKPGHTTIIQHEFHVGDTAPIHQRPYSIPYSRREAVNKELDERVASGVI